ncbi:MAG TPA: hypothetical protein VNA17_04355, partial [Pyrinomonadaceae bacterium]|nr:hypothetical protein [Pyrinomonadaceae bacterium]
MPCELTIIHVEDEYPEYLHLASNVRVMIEDLCEVEGQAQMADLNDLSDSLEKGTGAIYEIHIPGKIYCLYIFVRDEVIPQQIIDQIKGRRLFVLDVLRPDATGTQLTSSISKSLDCARELGASDSDIVLFTAHRGNGLDSPVENSPRRIGKETNGEIDEFFAEKLIECL